MTNMVKGLILGGVIGCLLTLLISLQVGLGLLKASHQQDVEAQILMANMAYESKDLESLVETQARFANCSIKFLEELENGIYSLHRDQEGIEKLRSSLKASPLPCE